MADRRKRSSPKRLREAERILEKIMPAETTRTDAGLFQFLCQASTLEGTLRLPDGRTKHFEWDADDEEQPPLRGLLLDILHQTVAEMKYRAAQTSESPDT